ncbi:baseplate J/gp47 family protein [Paenibacillus flagellatus]|uniref:Phage tail protein n=1 Tax=Paenibacillus flagellatus TaxID=2211139 RepID=A0A2V5KF78_9BACL|nr:baseplate J/gp47 family protein [Paenibacillus flagellatus]PYI57014.1 phage tail protein [Paenibacillus flagellatus]
MYEHLTYAAILKRMLDRVPNSVDKREGGIIYDALAPAAAELALMYMELDSNMNLSFADTATGEYLERRTAEYGINREPATKAKRKGLFFGAANAPVDVPLGSRFSIGSVTFVTVKKLATGQFEMEAETAGTVGNTVFGTLLPIDYVPGLSRAELADVLVPGEDEETDAALRSRYLSAINEQPFGGNIADYKRKFDEIPGVGGVKVFPAWQGGGTVKATLIASDFTVPSAQLVNDVQTMIDPVVNSGEGVGLAPIGHSVTIAAVAALTVNVETTVTLASGITIGQVEGDIQQAVSDYLLSLRQAWKDETQLVVRVSQIEARILGVDGVDDVTATKINGSGNNLTLGTEQIPTMGTVTIHGA